MLLINNYNYNNTVCVFRAWTNSPRHAAIGGALSDLRAGDPLGLAHHRPGVRQAAHVFHRHHQVLRRLQDPHGFVVRDAQKAAAVHLQDLVAHLRGGERAQRHGGED